MKLRFLAGLWVGTAAFAGTLGCSSDGPSGAGSAGTAGASNPSAGASGAGSSGAGASGAGSSGAGASGAGSSGAGSTGASGASGGMSGSACPENRTPLRSQGTLLSLLLRPVLNGKPFAFGESNALADGSSLVPLNFRFYISAVQLLRASGEAPVAVDVVTAAGSPTPYGVHFFNAEDAASSTLRVLAPPGQYSGLSFALGIELACNQQSPSELAEPLTDVSQMTWPHTGGFLFLRYEGRYTPGGNGGSSPAGSAGEIPPAVHMGGNIMEELVPTVRVSGGPLSIPENGSLERGLSLVVDELFEGATRDIDVSEVGGPPRTPDMVAGERLRRSLPDLNLFVLEP